MPALPGNWLSEAAQSFETTLEWLPHANATIALSSAEAYDGAQSLELTATNTLAPQTRLNTHLQQAEHEWSDGTEYTMSAYVYSPGGATNVRFLVNHRNSGGTQLGQYNEVVGQSSSSGFIKLETTITIPAGTTQLEPIVFFNATGQGVGTQHYVDQVFIGLSEPEPTVEQLPGNWLSAAEQSFEQTLGWEVNNNSTVALSASAAHDGTQSLSVVATNTLSPSARLAEPLAQANHGWTDGSQYVMSAYVYSPGGATNVRFLANHRDSGGAQLGQYNEVVGQSSGSDFTKLETVITIPAGTAMIEPIVFFNATAQGVGTQHYVDQVFLSQAFVGPGVVTVDAGADQYVAAGETIYLSGTVDNPNDEDLSYQ